MRWRKKSDKSYLALSNLGELYHGTVGGPIKDVMDSVDAGNQFLTYFSHMICEVHLVIKVSEEDTDV